MKPTMSPQEAVMAIVVTAAGIDGEVSKGELAHLRAMVGLVPLFAESDWDEVIMLVKHAIDVRNHLGDSAIAVAAQALDSMERETAFQLACDMVLADQVVGSEETEYLRKLALHLALEEDRAEAILTETRERNAGTS